MPITKRNDAEGREFWRTAEEARIKVEGWPKWKQDVRVTQFSVKYRGDNLWDPNQ